MKTQQLAFDERYHHIDAPTYTDGELTKQLGKRLLANPKEKPTQGKLYREPELTYLARNFWSYKRKLNGENMRVRWDGERAIWSGKTNKFTTDAATTEYMNSTFAEEIFEENFGRDKLILLFGERMAPKTQGNELELEKVEFVLFDAKICGTWLEPSGLVTIAKYFNIHTCYDFMRPQDAERGYAETLENLIDMVTKGEFKDWEGIVAIPQAGILNRKGERIIRKIKNQDYLRDFGSTMEG